MTTRRSLAQMIVVAGGSAVLALSGAGSAAAAGGGNSGAARACQQGGWETLVRADGSTFRNTGACVSYSARGGEFGTPEDHDSDDCQVIPGIEDDTYGFRILGDAGDAGSGRVWNDPNCTGNESADALYLTGDAGDVALPCILYAMESAGGGTAIYGLLPNETDEWYCWRAEDTQSWVTG
jgi:hypothetical protein